MPSEIIKSLVLDLLTSAKGRQALEVRKVGWSNALGPLCCCQQGGWLGVGSTEFLQELGA